jgi:hypothetical protein
MDIRAQAIEILRRTEGELQQLLLRTAQQGDYEAACMLAEWARQLKQIVEQNGPAEPAAFATTIHKGTNTARGNARRPTKAKTAKGPSGEYPKFLRDGDELLKIGWSRRDKKVYRHKAPKRVVLVVSRALQKAGQQSDRFGMERILPIRDPENDADVPSYQAYLSLAWIRKEKLIVQHGRQGYSLRPEINLTDAVEERWKLLRES